MIAILEIVLTVAAWRRGWRGWALIPAAAVLLTGFVIGLAIAASGGSAPALTPAWLLPDLVCVGVLAVMVARPHGQSDTASESVPSEQVGAPIACAEAR